MYNKELACAFTGHRVIEDFNIDELKEKINMLIGMGITVFYSGMAKGFDLIAAEAVTLIKRKNTDVKLIACVPCPEQDKYFFSSERKKYAEIIGQCDEIITLSDYYYNGCMQMRNRFLVDNARFLIAYLRRSSGGTFYTVNYAKSRGRQIICI